MNDDHHHRLVAAAMVQRGRERESNSKRERDETEETAAVADVVTAAVVPARQTSDSWQWRWLSAGSAGLLGLGHVSSLNSVLGCGMMVRVTADCLAPAPVRVSRPSRFRFGFFTIGFDSCFKFRSKLLSIHPAFNVSLLDPRL
ncbi:hypothetical protein Hanom_Chr02g00159631 [Helianthus anomalus]